MFLSIFEVLPAPGKKKEYLELTDYLKPMLEAIDGFVGTERFESRLRPGWMLANPRRAPCHPEERPVSAFSGLPRPCRRGHL